MNLRKGKKSVDLSLNKDEQVTLKFLQSEISAETDADVLINTCKKLSKTKTGALIVIERTNNLEFIANTGDTMYALINEALLESVFYKNGETKDIAEASDQLNISSLSTPVTKYFLCYPKTLTL